MSKTITTPACWCEKPATMTVPIDPEVTTWDGETRQSDGMPALAVCDEHARDGYERLAVSELGNFQLGSWTADQLHDVRAVALATDDNEELVLAIDAELESRIESGHLEREEAQLGRRLSEAALQDRTTDVLAELILRNAEGPGGLSKARLEALAQGLPSALWSELAAKIEVCPVHVCDYRICEEDEDDECLDERTAR